MRAVALLATGVALSTLILEISGQSSVWTYICENKRCMRTATGPGLNGVPMDVCKLTCDDNVGSLFPRPSGPTQISRTLTAIYPSNISFTGFSLYPQPVRTLFEGATTIFKDYLEKMNPSPWPETPADPIIAQNQLIVSFSITDTAQGMVTLGMDESYRLSISLSTDNKIVTAAISAPNFYGARHGLETLNQLIAFDEDKKALQVVNTATIEDKPAYQYRGVMLDTSRNFISFDGLKRLIDGLSFHKLNMFHWHITDTHSFPMEVDGHPNFTLYGAYSQNKVYSVAEMRELVAYANVRGVKIVPEFDEPAHTGYGWQWGPEAGLGNLAVCVNKQPWYDFCVEPPCGQLNIVNENMYNLLGAIFNSMLSIFDKDLFHMGGDEVDLRCYNTTPEITDYMRANNIPTDRPGFMEMWNMFQEKAHEKLLIASGNANTQSILWTSELTHMEYVEKFIDPAKYIIQNWESTTNPIFADLVNAGYRTILSNYDAMYLDCGFQNWIGGYGHNWCSPYKGWQQIYDHNPHAIYANATNSTAADDAFQKGLLLGGETPLWTEQADEQSFETRIWPRASALAERLWTNPSTNWAEAEFRMVTNRQRLINRGVGADRLQPEFCSQYQENCYGYQSSEGPDDPSTSQAPTDTPTPTTLASTTPDGRGTAALENLSILLLLIVGVVHRLF